MGIAYVPQHDKIRIFWGAGNKKDLAISKLSKPNSTHLSLELTPQVKKK
jgi:hypothetical protein